MLVLGLNKGKNEHGKALDRGGLAIAMNGDVKLSLTEERISRVKWDGGYRKSLQYVLERAWPSLGIERHLVIEDFDIIAISTCCENANAALLSHPFRNHASVVSVNHHLSHAYLAFHSSSFKTALIVVCDSGGNIFSSDLSPKNWWQHEREQFSVYIGHDGQVDLVEQEFEKPYAVGFAELYRAFTLFLGFENSGYAQKLMALSAYGSADRISKSPIFYQEDNHLCCPIKNQPYQYNRMIDQLGRDLDIDFGEPRRPGSEILPVHVDMAAFVQKNIEIAFLEKVKNLVDKYKIRNVCFAGGLALNCVMNGKLKEDAIVDDIYVPSAPGDEGQAIGNAIWASVNNLKYSSNKIRKMSRSSDVQLGPEYRVTSADIAEFLKKSSIKNAITFESRNLPLTIAKILSSGSAVCVFRGRSEVGPRALGNRSILADARNYQSRDILNSIKKREWFQPVAPTVMTEHLQDFFTSDLHSPFMSFAVQLRKDKASEIPAAVHSNGSARVQTVGAEDKTLLRDILQEFKKMTGTPVLLNTSFNRLGEAIVETPNDAVQAFADMPVNVLVLDRFIIVKSLHPHLKSIGLLPTLPINNVMILDGSKKLRSPHKTSIDKVLRWLHEKTNQILFVRCDFPLYGEYLNWLEAGRKVTTIRFRKGAIEYPNASVLPMFSTVDYTLQQGGKFTQVRIHAVKYQRFGELTEADAKRDGFTSFEEMRIALKNIYKNLEDEDWVTIYTISSLAQREEISIEVKSLH